MRLVPAAAKIAAAKAVARPQIAIPEVATPDIFEKGSRGAEIFPMMDPGSMQQIQAVPGPFDPPAEVPPSSVAPQSASPESSD